MQTLTHALSAILVTVALFPASARAGEKPLYDQTFFEPCAEVVTPHIPWFKPLQGRKPKVLFITHRNAMREVIELAQRLDGEIVSADSRYLYRGMDIGTAKPNLEERARVPHYLIDIANPDETISLAVFQKKAKDIIVDIHTRGKLPFLVGGTGQYVRAVTQGWTPPEVIADEKLRAELGRIASMEEKGPHWLHARLQFLDPEAAAKIDARNVRRTIRALEVILTTGRKFSKQRGQSNSPYHLITIGLTRPRAELYERVDQRIDAMFENGFVDEVKGLLAAPRGYSPTLPSMSAIGYRECIRVVNDQWSVEQAKVEIRRATRIFVRRQANWFKESDPNIMWFRVQAGIQNEIMEYIQQNIAAGNDGRSDETAEDSG